MWGIVHNLIDPGKPAPAEAECSCGWRGTAAQLPEHIAKAAKESRDRITEFVDFVDEKVGTGKWRDIDMFAPGHDCLTPASFVTAMRNLGFKRIS